MIPVSAACNVTAGKSPPLRKLKVQGDLLKEMEITPALFFLFRHFSVTISQAYHSLQPRISTGISFYTLSAIRQRIVDTHVQYSLILGSLVIKKKFDFHSKYQRKPEDV